MLFYLFKKYEELESELFTAKDYRYRFNHFVKHFPVILSSTLSLKTCISGEYLFDYLIIDESSQVDIIKSADKEIIKPKHSLIKRTL